MRWPLQPLLDLRRRESTAAERALGRAMACCQAAEAEALALRGEAARGRAAASLPAAAHWIARLGQDAGRLHARASEADERARVARSDLERRRADVQDASARREVVERLGATWRAARKLEAARRAEAALDDRPWPRRAG